MLRELALKFFTYFKNSINILFKNLLFLIACTTQRGINQTKCEEPVSILVFPWMGSEVGIITSTSPPT